MIDFVRWEQVAFAEELGDDAWSRNGTSTP